MRAVQPGVRHRARSHLRRQTQPACIQAVNQTRKPFALEIEFLQEEEQPGAKISEDEVVDQRAIELMAVDRDVAAAAILPNVYLVNLNADQVRHDVGETLIVVSLDPDNFHVAFGIRQLADVGQKVPVLFLQAPEVEVAEDIAEKNEPAEGDSLQHPDRIPGARKLRAQMQVRQNQGVVAWRFHCPIFSAGLLQGYESAEKIW